MNILAASLSWCPYHHSFGLESQQYAYEHHIIFNIRQVSILYMEQRCRILVPHTEQRPSTRAAMSLRKPFTLGGQGSIIYTVRKREEQTCPIALRAACSSASWRPCLMTRKFRSGALPPSPASGPGARSPRRRWTRLSPCSRWRWRIRCPPASSRNSSTSRGLAKRFGPRGVRPTTCAAWSRRELPCLSREPRASRRGTRRHKCTLGRMSSFFFSWGKRDVRLKVQAQANPQVEVEGSENGGSQVFRASFT